MKPVKSLKEIVRSRMRRTGESYSEALAAIQAADKRAKKPSPLPEVYYRRPAEEV